MKKSTYEPIFAAWLILWGAFGVFMGLSGYADTPKLSIIMGVLFSSAGSFLAGAVVMLRCLSNK